MSRVCDTSEMDGAVTCLITDDRRTVQTLALLVGADRAYAREHALRDLAGNAHHQAVEAWAGEERLFVVTRDDLGELHV